MREEIKKIIESGTKAPSGDNCQPWKIIVKGSIIDIYNDPAKDTSLYNCKQAASHIAHGALIENMLIASKALGYQAEASFFPSGFANDHVATIKLTKGASSYEPLFTCINERSNNRKSYAETPLSKIERKEFFDAASNTKGAELKLADTPILKNSIAVAGSSNEKVVLANKYLHHFFFSHVMWSEEEARDKGWGIYVKTLEMPKPGEIIFKLCSKWPIMKLLNLVGLPNLVSKQNEMVYRRSGEFGAIIIEDDSPKSFLAAGRMIERVWLTATKLGLGFNAMAGVTLLAYNITSEGGKNLKEIEKKMIMSAYGSIMNAFKVEKDIIPFVFRVGKTDSPSARSFRLPLEKVVTNN